MKQETLEVLNNERILLMCLSRIERVRFFRNRMIIKLLESTVENIEQLLIEHKFVSSKNEVKK